jgi:uncharacterized protein YlaN (UPF0358 family)
MALLKSAWEIALEKTEGIEADREKIKKEEAINRARRLAGTFLSEVEDQGASIEKAYSDADTETKELYRQGIATTIIANLALPQYPEFEERVKKMAFLTQLIDDEESVQLIDQAGKYMAQYLENRDSLLERSTQQYAPIYEQKREMMAQQYGRAPSTPMDQDPEFIKLLQKSFAQLSQQFQQALDQIKELLKEKFSLS